VSYFIAVLLAVPIVAIGGVLAARVTSGLTESAEGGPHHGARDWTIRIAAILPFICVAWCLLVSLWFTTGNRDAAGQTYVPLASGYGFSVTGLGGEIAQRGPTEPSLTNSHEAVSCIQSIQIVGARVLGFVRSRGRGCGLPGAGEYYFLRDFSRGTEAKFTTFGALQTAAREKEITVDLAPSTQVYARLSGKSNEWIFALALTVPPLAAITLLWMAIERLRGLPAPPRRW
jgi:hypothetical protein